jgi:hypothetical protein
MPVPTFLREQHMRLFDTTVGTFLEPPFASTATKYLKRWSEEGTDTGIEEHDMLLVQQFSTFSKLSTLYHTSFNERLKLCMLYFERQILEISGGGLAMAW